MTRLAGNRPIDKLDYALMPLHRRWTRPRALVFQMLGWIGPATITQLVERLHGQVSQRAIYGIVKVFRELNIVVALPDRRFELAHPYRYKHFHTRCQACGSRSQYFDQGIDSAIHRWSRQFKQNAPVATLEINWYCALCRQNRQVELTRPRSGQFNEYNALPFSQH